MSDERNRIVHSMSAFSKLTLTIPVGSEEKLSVHLVQEKVREATTDWEATFDVVELTGKLRIAQAYPDNPMQTKPVDVSTGKTYHIEYNARYDSVIFKPDDDEHPDWSRDEIWQESFPIGILIAFLDPYQQ